MPVLRSRPETSVVHSSTDGVVRSVWFPRVYRQWSEPATCVARRSVVSDVPSSWVEGSSPRVLRRLEPGQLLGRYRLLERIGEGGQGEVWRAVPVDAVRREVALKVLPATMASDPRRRAQFRREAERGTRLAGPALLPTYEFGEVDGAAFMAMPFVDCCTLAAVLRQRRARLTGDEESWSHTLVSASDSDYRRAVVSQLAQVARGLASAHCSQVAHCDVKPANILLDRGSDRVFLCDFGLGRDLDVVTTAQLRDGAGTLLYMAPERLLRRNTDEVRCDIYSLGVTLFEALTLMRPLEVPSMLSSPSWACYLAAAEPPRPRQVRYDLPAALEAVILRAMERDPNHRYPTAAALADDLDLYLRETARPAGRPRTGPYHPHTQRSVRR
ncbi:MAG: serine/threonine-protein kinase [Isosphaeraceae bacterium]|nr:serine/threonine-protein kinase [Isosphaeraceae bacterium]